MKGDVVLERIKREGGTVVSTHTEDGTFYSTKSGVTVSRASMDRLLRNGQMEPCGDGLFGHTQTFKIVENGRTG